MSLEDYGAKSWPSLRAIERDDHGDVVCPASGDPIEHTRGDLEVPVVRLQDDQLQEHLEDSGVEWVRSRGYESHSHDLLVPETVEGPKAMAYSSRMVGVRADLGPDGEAWIPAHSDDLAAADRSLEIADSSAAADGSGVTTDESASPATGSNSAPASAVSDDVRGDRPDAVDELDLPTSYEDGHPRWTYVGHVIQDDETTVNAGRSGPNGQLNLITQDEIGKPGWLGNPFKTERAGGDYSLEESVSAFVHAFMTRLEEEPELREAVHDLRGEVLGCYCHRLEETGEDHQLCHADVIARVADRVIQRRDRADQSGGER